MTELSVPWGQEQLKIVLPAHWSLVQTAQSSLRAAEKDWPERIALALSQPCTGLALPKLLAARRSGRIVLVLEDATRHSPLPAILEIVLREFRHARIPDEQIEVLFATGMHPPMTPQQAAAKLGPAGEPLRWRSNPWQDPRHYAQMWHVAGLDVRIERSLLEADLRIIISSVSPHLQAGFGGGYKMYLPGCSHIETIRSLHRLGINRTGRQLVGLNEGENPMRAAIDQAGAAIDERAGKTFALQYLLDDENLPAFVAAGEVLPTYRMVAKQCAVACGIVPASPADVLIANATRGTWTSGSASSASPTPAGPPAPTG